MKRTELYPGMRVAIRPHSQPTLAYVVDPSYRTPGFETPRVGIAIERPAGMWIPAVITLTGILGPADEILGAFKAREAERRANAAARLAQEDQAHARRLAVLAELDVLVGLSFRDDRKRLVVGFQDERPVRSVAERYVDCVDIKVDDLERIVRVIRGLDRQVATIQ